MDSNLNLVAANKTRIKLTQLSILLRKSKESLGREKDMMIDRCVNILSKMKIEQEKTINRIINQMRDDRGKIIATARSESSSALERPNQDMFAENPFIIGVSEPTSSNDFNEFPQEFPSGVIDEEPPAEPIDEQALEKLQNMASQSSLLLGSLQKTQSLLDLIITKETEAEMDIKEDQHKCLIHRGPILGVAYICPKCMAMYCLRCARTLSEQGEKCWSCEETIHT